jgi:hypothetical protein
MQDRMPIASVVLRAVSLAKIGLRTEKLACNCAVAAAGVKLGGNVAKMEVREVESAFA